MKKLIIILMLLLPASVLLSQQTAPAGISFKMEELTSPQFAKAVELSRGVCIIPLGIIEKHGPHLPIGTDPVNAKEIESLRKAKPGGHADEDETSMMYYIRPELVNLDAIKNESGLDQGRLDMMPFGYTGIWWYARYPNHYASDVYAAE